MRDTMDASFPTSDLDPRFAALAVAVVPAWFWRADGARVLWANAAGCAAFGAANAKELAERSFDPADPRRREVVRLAATLAVDGAPRLERLRSFAGRTASWQAPACSCAIVPIGDGSQGVLIVATEQAAPMLPRAERVRRLGFDPADAAAAFATDGALLFATDEAKDASVVHTAAAAPTAMAESTLPAAAAAAAPMAAGVPQPMAEPDSPIAAAETAATGAIVTSPARATRSRPLPLRFTWQMDAAGRFTLGSDEFTELIGNRTAIALGRPWQEIAEELALDPDRRFAAATAVRETFSSVILSWPVDGSPERLDVEFSGLPAFDRARNFLGYRGFGVCRDTDRIENLRMIRRFALFAHAPAGSDEERSEAAPTPDPRHHDETTPAAPAPSSSPASQNVVRFPAAPAADARLDPDLPMLSPGEHYAFREISRRLTTRLQDDGVAVQPAETLREHKGGAPAAGYAVAAAEPVRSPAWLFEQAPVEPAEERRLLDLLPSGILVYRLDELLFANRAFLDLTGFPDLDALAMAGGLDALFVESSVAALLDAGAAGSRQFAVATPSGALPVDGRLYAITWGREGAHAIMLARIDTDERVRAAAAALRRTEAQARELRLMLEATSDAVLIIDGAGAVLSGDRGTETVFGRRPVELIGSAFPSLFAPQSRAAATEVLAKAHRGAGVATADLVADRGRQVSLTIRRTAADNGRFGVVVREVVLRESAARELAAAPPPPRPSANTDLSNIEAVAAVPSRSAADLNATAAETIARLQAEADAGRVVIRLSLADAVPAVAADAAAVARMAMILLRHAVSVTRPGGQVIVSTGRSAPGGGYLRVRSGGDGSKANGGASPADWGEALHLVASLAEANQATFKAGKAQDGANSGALFELSFAVSSPVAG
jgi:PAS domain S-box-containing protein